MRDALKSYLALAGGVTEVTRQRALEAAKALVSQGEAAAEQVTSLAEDLLSQTRQNREAVVALVGFEVDRALGRVGLATADEVTELTSRVRQLEAQLAEASRSTPRAEAVPAAGSSSSPTPARRGQASAGEAAVTAVDETEARKAPSRAGSAAQPRKAPTRRGPARATATSLPAEKSPAAKASAAKSPAAKASAAKASAQKPANEGSAEKASAKKASARKAPSTRSTPAGTSTAAGPAGDPPSPS